VPVPTDGKVGWGGRVPMWRCSGIVKFCSRCRIRRQRRLRRCGVQSSKGVFLYAAVFPMPVLYLWDKIYTSATCLFLIPCSPLLRLPAYSIAPSFCFYLSINLLVMLTCTFVPSSFMGLSFKHCILIFSGIRFDFMPLPYYYCNMIVWRNKWFIYFHVFLCWNELLGPKKW
jgi:hypothetical protein